MACTEYEDIPDPLTVYNSIESCCEDDTEDVTNYNPPARGSELFLEGNLVAEPLGGYAGAILPVGTLAALPGLGYLGSIGPTGLLSVIPLVGLSGFISPSGSLDSVLAGVLAMGPWGWWDANDPAAITAPYPANPHPANAAEISTWEDKSGNTRHFPYDTVFNRKPRFWSTASSGSGSPSNLPNTGLPVVGTVDTDGLGSKAFGTINGGLVSFGTGSYTIFVVGRKVDPTGILPFFGSQNAGGIGDVCMFVGPNNSGATPSVFIQYRTNPSATSTNHRYSRAVGTITSNNYWKFTFQRDSAGVAHHIWKHNTEITTVGTDNVGSPLVQNFLVQYLLKTMSNTGAETPFAYHMCEAIIFNRLLTTDERNFVWAYLDDKWGLS